MGLADSGREIWGDIVMCNGYQRFVLGNEEKLFPP